MEELLLKGIELGALGIVTVLLLTKGLTLADSQKTLAKAIDKLADTVNVMDGRLANVEREVRDLRNDFLETKQMIKSIWKGAMRNDTGKDS